MLSQANYYLLSVGIILVALAVMVVRFEGRRPRAREVVTLSVLTALAVAGRAAFFMLPQFKPVAAIVIIAGVALGAESGFLVGALAAFTSNFLFGQGPWTPFQMLGFGLVGMLAGLLFHGRWPLSVSGTAGTGQLPHCEAEMTGQRIHEPQWDSCPVSPDPALGSFAAARDNAEPEGHSLDIPGQIAALMAGRQSSRLRLALLCIFGGVAVVAIYGPIVDASYLLMFSESLSSTTLVAVLASGLPFNLIHAAATVFFLLVLAPTMLEKLERVRMKFGLFTGQKRETKRDEAAVRFK
ncbi:MAG: ECF transporter S component [Coriobacteriales bacterium]|jgi:hypothetical protein|nr:ECF transporter S component [Coriobacteriales bacterium]